MPETSILAEVAGLVVGAAVTVMILSYFLGDNPLYRLAVHLFIGALVGYTFGVVLREALFRMALAELADNPVLLVPLLMGIWLLFFKSIPRLAYVGNFVVAFLIGVGTAVALGGALIGTLIPQLGATSRALSAASIKVYPLGVVDGLLIPFGTVSTLMAFHFASQERQGLAGVWGRIVGLLAWFGRGFLTVALGVAFAGALTASLSVFAGRVQYMIDVFLRAAGLIAG